jgi:hypothetical protein
VNEPASSWNEPVFDPLDECQSDESEFEFEIGSGDDSLEGENDEWLQESKRARTGDTFSSSVDVSQPMPRLDYEDIPILFQGPADAEKVNRFFVVERRTEPMPGEDVSTKGFTPGIEGFEVWKRGDYGCGL